MGLSLFAYLLLSLTGSWLFVSRQTPQVRPGWLRPVHFTIGHYGSLGHSSHLPAGLIVVGLTLLSAWSATQINVDRPWARGLHLGTNLVLLLAFAIVTWTGWDVVQKYLP